MHIDGYAFGRISIDGEEITKDVVIVRGKVRSPWWRRSGHVFARTDLEEVIAAAPEVVVLGTGFFGLATVEPEVESAFEDAGTRVIMGRTQNVVGEFNRLAAEGCTVAAALHLTC